MNIKREISPVLYQAIRFKYESGLYRDAILAATFQLEECIKHQANLGDATINDMNLSCIKNALAMPNPLIKLNNLDTVSQFHEQSGFGQIILGVFQGIAYSRSHGEWHDDKKTADAIIIFVDYLINRIQNSMKKAEGRRESPIG